MAAAIRRLTSARTAKRLGATETLIVYRRNREKMPAHNFEVEEAIEEGIQFKWLSTIKQAGDTTSQWKRCSSTKKDFLNQLANSRPSKGTRWCWR